MRMKVKLLQKEQSSKNLYRPEFINDNFMKKKKVTWTARASKVLFGQISSRPGFPMEDGFLLVKI